MASSKQPQPDGEPEAVPWVFLSAIPRTLAVPRIPLALVGERLKDVIVELERPPLLSTLCAGRHIVPRNEDIVPKLNHPFLSDPVPLTRRYPYIVAAESSGALLICASHRADRDSAPYLNCPRFYLCDAIKGTTEELADAGMSLDCPLYSLDHPGRVGIIRDTAGRLLVADLQPVPLHGLNSKGDQACLLRHVVGTGVWENVSVGRPPREDDFVWAYHGVLAHVGWLWWCDLSYGLLSCNAFTRKPLLVHTAFAQESHPPSTSKHRVQVDLDKTRCVRVSANRLRFVMVEDDGRASVPAITMWSLDDEDGAYQWVYDYRVDLTAICSEEKLLGEEATVLAAVHPFNPRIIYTWLGFKLTSFDTEHDKLVDSGEAFMLSDELPEDEFPSSRLLHAWILPPALHRAFHDQAAGSMMDLLKSSVLAAPPDKKLSEP